MIVGLILFNYAKINIDLGEDSFNIGFEERLKDGTLDRDVERSIVIDRRGERHSSKKSEERHIVIQFDDGEVVDLADSEPRVDSFFEKNKESLDRGLHGIHLAFIVTSWFVVMVYLLNTLYADRKDRSILFWKSMPISETRVIANKLAVGLVAVPIVATLASWVVQLVYAVMAMIIASQMDQNPWQVIAPNLHILSAFVSQLGLVLYISLWALPFCAWLLVASAFAKRSPFLTAVLPIIGVLILEELLFGSSYFIDWLSVHTPFNEGTVDALVKNGGLQLSDPMSMVFGFIVAGGLLFGAVWLRNNRFEI
jgi:ABC-2 type transport system permease protein